MADIIKRILEAKAAAQREGFAEPFGLTISRDSSMELCQRHPWPGKTLYGMDVRYGDADALIVKRDHRARLRIDYEARPL